MTPPSYTPPPPRFRLTALQKQLLACAGIVGVVGLILAPVFLQAQNSARYISCLSNLKSRGVALLQYAEDYDQHLPLATEWQTHTEPRQREERGACPSLRTPEPGVSGYAMDSRLSGRALRRLGAEPAERVVLFESSRLSPNAHDPGASFTVRHGYGGVVFADGHAKMLPAASGSTIVRGNPLSPP